MNQYDDEFERSESEVSQLIDNIKKINEGKEKELKKQDILYRAVIAAVSERFGDDYANEYMVREEDLKETIEEYNARVNKEKYERAKQLGIENIIFTDSDE